MEWKEFITELDTLLGNMAATQSSEPVIRFDPNARTPDKAGEALLGVGEYASANDDALVLNPKGLPPEHAGRYLTTSDLILDAEGPAHARIRAWLPDAGSVSDLLASASFVVKDAAPDTAGLGIISLLAVRAGVPAEQVPKEWLHAARIWKRGMQPPSPEHSWPTLLAALAHSYFGAADEEGPAVTNEQARQAVLAALRLTARLMVRDVDPNNVPVLDEEPLYQRARAFIDVERREYETSLPQATLLQLAVPVAGTPDRRILVDAYFATEIYPSGLRKIFIRDDAAHSELEQGFPVMGLYRPEAEMTGNDMTISADPRFSLSLESLWDELERLEWERWGADRPRSHPRRGIAKYDASPDQACDQPWWDGAGRYDLIAAPRAVTVDGQKVPGTKLSWEEVLDATWRCYSPVNGLRVRIVRTGISEPIDLYKAEPEHHGPSMSGKRLLILKWDGEATDRATRSAFAISGTVKRAFAGIIARPTEEVGHPLRLWSLPELDEFQKMPLSGGFAIIHQRGLFAFDDWQAQPLFADDCRRAFDRACAILEEAVKANDRLAATVEAFDRDRNQGREEKAGEEALEQLNQIKKDLYACQLESEKPPASPDYAELRDALLKQWGAPEQLDDLYRRIGEAEQHVERQLTLSERKPLKLFARYSIPVFIAGTLAPFVESAIAPPTYSTGSWWLGISIYAGLALLLVLITRKFLFRS